MCSTSCWRSTITPALALTPAASRAGSKERFQCAGEIALLHCGQCGEHGFELLGARSASGLVGFFTQPLFAARLPCRAHLLPLGAPLQAQGFSLLLGRRHAGGNFSHALGNGLRRNQYRSFYAETGCHRTAHARASHCRSCEFYAA